MITLFHNSILHPQALCKRRRLLERQTAVLRIQRSFNASNWTLGLQDVIRFKAQHRRITESWWIRLHISWIHVVLTEITAPPVNSRQCLHTPGLSPCAHGFVFFATYILRFIF